MTSISAFSSNNYTSPLQRLQDELTSEVNSGTISSSDQSALSSALNDIDSSLRPGVSSDQSSGTRPSPGDISSKINDLIQNGVSSGKLTSDQATELQGVFKAAFANGPGGAGGPGGSGGADGPPPGPPPSDSSSSSDGSGSSSGDNSVAQLLQQFLQSLQSSLSSSSSSSYDGSGSSGNSSGSSISALLIDYQS